MICDFGRRVIYILFLSRLRSASAAALPLRNPALLMPSSLIQMPHSSKMNTLHATTGDAYSSEVSNILKLFVDKTCAGTLVSCDSMRQPNSTEVKSLIWEYDGCPMVIVIDESKQVDVSLLAQFCGVPPEAVSLVSRERAVQLAGTAFEVIQPKICCQCKRISLHVYSRKRIQIYGLLHAPFFENFK